MMPIECENPSCTDLDYLVVKKLIRKRKKPNRPTGRIRTYIFYILSGNMPTQIPEHSVTVDSLLIEKITNDLKLRFYRRYMKSKITL